MRAKLVLADPMLRAQRAKALARGAPSARLGRIAALLCIGVVLALALALLFAPPAGAAVEQARLAPSDGFPNDGYGWDLDVSGDVLVVGSILGEEVNVFRKNGSSWDHEALLAGSVSWGRFGSSVAVDGDVLVVGAMFAGSTGEAYVFRHDGTSWVSEATLVPTTTPDYYFGLGVAVSGDVIVVGSVNDDTLGDDAGAAHVFRFNGTSWNEEVQLLAPDGGSGHNFGSGVAITGVGPGAAIVVGASGDDDVALNSGAAYVYRFNGAFWNQEAKLLPTVASDYSYTGGDVDIDGDVVVAGAWGADDLGFSTGAAYVFRRAGPVWSEEIRLAGSFYPAAGDQFGGSVAVSGETVVVGARRNDQYALDAGQINIYRLDGPSPGGASGVFVSEVGEYGNYGHAVALDGNVLAVSAPGHDGLGPDAGSAYVLEDRGNGYVPWGFPLPRDGIANDELGGAVALSGDAAPMSAPTQGDAQEGGAYVARFDGTSWSHEQKIKPSGLGTGARFGHAVALEGDLAVIGAPYHASAGTDAGATYVYRYDGSSWVHEQKLLPTGVVDWALFGSAVAIGENKIVVGAPGHFNPFGFTFPGAVYVFEHDGTRWTEAHVIWGINSGDTFGHAVDISGSSIAVGAPNHNEGNAFGGAAYLFREGTGTWFQDGQFMPFDLQLGDAFGSAVAVSRGSLLVGAPLGQASVLDSGVVYAYRNWQGQGPFNLEAVIEAPAPASGDQFGHSLSLDAPRLVVGAYAEGPGGGAHIYELRQGSWVAHAAPALSTASGDAAGYAVAVSGTNVAVGSPLADLQGDASGAVSIFADTRCSDGLDEDADGDVDTADPDCADALDATEFHLEPGDVVAAAKDDAGSLVRVDLATGISTYLYRGGLLRTPQDVVVEADGRLLVADSEAAALFRFDPADGSLALVTSGGFLVEPLALDLEPSGQAIVIDRALQSVLRIDPTSGAQTWLSSGGELDTPIGLTVTDAGRIFVSEYHWSAQVLEIDPFIGLQTEVLAGLSYPSALGSGPAGELYTGISQSPVAVVRIDPDTGATTPIGGIMVPFVGMADFALQADGRVLVSDPFTMTLWHVDPADGSASTAAFVQGIGGLDVIPLPEPTALLQLGCGALTLLVLRRRAG